MGTSHRGVFTGRMRHGYGQYFMGTGLLYMLANALNVTTTAEGVETEQQLEQIRRLGFTEMQGYLFSQPLPGAKPFPLQWSLAPR